MTLKECITNIIRQLQPTYSENEARWMARVIFEQLKGYTQVDLIIHADDTVSDFILTKINNVISRLLDHEPIQYIFGETKFYGITLKVNRNVLIPRPETEELVDMIVSDADNREDLRVADICTGSGCIAIALARNLKFPIITAVDISEPALEVARQNALMTKTNITFRRLDALNLPPVDPSARLDIVVSNPPYIGEAERTSMEKNVLDYEPQQALFVPDSNPLLFYKAISLWAMQQLKPGGKIYFELNPFHANDLTKWMTANGWDNVTLIPDMQKLTRFLTAQKPKE